MSWSSAKMMPPGPRPTPRPMPRHNPRLDDYTMQASRNYPDGQSVPRIFRMVGWSLLALALGGVPLLCYGWSQGVGGFVLLTLGMSMASAAVTGWNALHGGAA